MLHVVHYKKVTEKRLQKLNTIVITDAKMLLESELDGSGRELNFPKRPKSGRTLQ